MNARRRWEEILSRAGSDGEFDRAGALTQASTQIDLALTAIGRGRTKRETTMLQLKRARADSPYAGWPDHDRLLDAFSARHAAVHEHSVPAPTEAEDFVTV